MTNPDHQPMTCEDRRDAMPLFVSKDLGVAAQAAVERHLNTCDACRREIEEQAAIDQLVRDAFQREPIATWGVERYVRERMTARHGWLGWFRPLLSPMPVLATAALIAALLVAVWQWRPERTSPLYLAAYADHTKDGHELDGWNESPDAIARFVRHELGSNAIPATLDAQGFHLTRARLCSLGGPRFVHLVFVDARGEMVSLFVRRDNRALAGRPARVVDGIPVHLATVEGGRVTAFEKHAHLMLLVSTLPADRHWALAETSATQS